jgi:hypothetical protein
MSVDNMWMGADQFEIGVATLGVGVEIVDRCGIGWGVEVDMLEIVGIYVTTLVRVWPSWKWV